MSEIVAENLRGIMSLRDLNPSQLAKNAGVNPTGVYDILSGKSRSPRLDTIGKLAKALGVPVSSLLESQGEARLRHQIVDLYSQLPQDERERLLLTAEAWLRHKRPV